ncbi:MAG TPA: TetR/AcrR family transcriptional regulator [Gaiellaceae bacterium]|nr:TetR/AcrR family transcriptional regulator [Gaiellaceae bacterium]
MPRGRPRSEESRRAILAAADELLLRQGLDETSMDAVAEHAGASKATIYRWWASKELLALDALVISLEDALARVREDTGTLRGDLRAILRPVVRQLSNRAYARVVAALIAEAHRDAAFAEAWEERYFGARSRHPKSAFRRAIERGEIPAKTDVDLAVDMIFGPLYHRLLHGHAPVNQRVAYQLVDNVLMVVAGSNRSA